MYIWRVDSLIKDLKTGINEMEQFKYLIINILIANIALFIPVNHNMYDYINNAVTIIIVVIVLLICFIINGGKQGTGFVSRYLGLSFVLLIRYLFFIFIAYVVFMFFSPIGTNIDGPTTMVDVVMNGIILSGYSYLLIFYFQKLNKIEKTPNE